MSKKQRHSQVDLKNIFHGDSKFIEVIQDVEEKEAKIHIRHMTKAKQHTVTTEILMVNKTDVFSPSSAKIFLISKLKGKKNFDIVANNKKFSLRYGDRTWSLYNGLRKTSDTKSILIHNLCDELAIAFRV